MNSKEEIRYMKVRMIRLATENWHLSADQVIDLFEKYNVLEYIEACYGIFHVEGDEAILEDIASFIKRKEEADNDRIA